jgi:hypothetical protein
MKLDFDRHETMPAVVDGLHLLLKAQVQSFKSKEEAESAFEKAKVACLVQVIDE